MCLHEMKYVVAASDRQDGPEGACARPVLAACKCITVFLCRVCTLTKFAGTYSSRM